MKWSKYRNSANYAEITPEVRKSAYKLFDLLSLLTGLNLKAALFNAK
jgi:hypothetical protein